jgi:hypothetical protein
MTGGLSLPANGLVAGTNQLVLAGGNIGIGTTSPQRALDINGTLGNSSGDISLLAASGHRLNISGSSSYAQLVPADNTIGNPIYYEVHNQGTGQGSPNGLRMGISGANFNGVAYLDTFNGGVAVATPLALKTQGTERLRIDTNGNVGIGTINPVAMLHVNGSIVGNGSLSSSGGDFTFMDGGVSDSTATRLFSGSGNLYLQNGSGGNTYFRSKTASTLVTIQNSGNVGIGTTNPNQKLSVAGTVESTGCNRKILFSDRYKIWRGRNL